MTIQLNNFATIGAPYMHIMAFEFVQYNYDYY